MSGEKGIKVTRFTLRQFVAAGRDRLKLEIVVDAGLDHLVDEPMMYRPGLALTGFFGNFAKYSCGSSVSSSRYMPMKPTFAVGTSLRLPSSSPMPARRIGTMTTSLESS